MMVTLRTSRVCFILMIKQLFTTLTNVNFEEIDYFDTVFLLK